jgi:lysophospholipase
MTQIKLHPDPAEPVQGPRRHAPYGFLQTEKAIQLRYGHWPCESACRRGTAIVLGGRTEFMEKYLTTFQALQARGLDVFSLDWRGQGLSSRLLRDPTRGYIRSYDQYVSDLEFFFRKIVLPNARGLLIAVAHSMGAHILLHYLNKNPDGMDKAVLISPMIDIRTAPVPNALARLCCRLMIKLGKASQNLPAMRRNDAYRRRFSKNLLTHSKARFNQIQLTLCQNPQLVITGVTYGWLSATFESIDTIHRPGFAQQISTPMLVVVAGEDHVVRNQAVIRFAAQLPERQVFRIAGAYHEILQESEPLQSQFWQVFDRFVIA